MNEIYFLGPIILIAVVLVSALLDRWGVPVILITLAAGIICGSDVLNLWDFGDVHLTNQIANAALIFILFQGGFSTRRKSLRPIARTACVLATAGVILTALATFSVLWGLLNWSVEKAMLLAAIISSTDAAATFSILRRQSLPAKLSSTLEVESAINDPMAILLTLGAIQFLTADQAPLHMVALTFVWKFLTGIGIGWLLGLGAIWLFNRLRPQDRGHYYVLSLGVVLLIYGLAEQIESSEMLAVFVAGYVMGNHPFVHKQGVANFVSALSTVADTGMFVLMGLLVYPHKWSNLWIDGVVVFLVLTFISRPLAVRLSTLGTKVSREDWLFLSWAGLRGAVPIILATYPMAAGMQIGEDIFNLAFFAVLLSVAIQGSTLGTVSRWLKLSSPSRPKPLYNLELISMAKSDMDLFVLDVPGENNVPGPRIADLHLPAGAVIALITRGADIIAPKGGTRLQGGDQITVLAHVKDESALRAAFPA